MTPRVRSHVELCDGCRQGWHRLNATVRLLDAVPQPTVPADLRHRVMTAVDTRAARRIRPLVRPGWAAVAATLALGLVTAGQLSQRPQQPMLVAGADDLRPATYLQQHAMVAAADPLSDAAMRHALGTLALRTELGADRATDEL